MLHYLKTDMTVLERQRARMKWRADQLPQQHDGGDCGSFSSVIIQASRVEDFQDLLASSGRPELGYYDMPTTEFDSSVRMSPAVSRTLKCSPAVTVTVQTSSAAAGETSKKRKANKELKTKVGSVQSVGSQVVAEAEGRDKIRVKPSVEDEESKITEQNTAKSRGTSVDETSKQNSKVSEVQQSGYIHVRARRGQATDSHSLAERARREKISERMKYLQNLVPGCNKIAGKAGMLDEIINYVQSLQQQVEFLSMKLAAQNPSLDFNVDDLFAKQVFPTIEMPPELANSSYFDQLGIGTTSVTVTETPLINSASFTHQHFELSSIWGDDLQSLHNMAFEQGRPPLPSPSSFLSQQYSGNEDEKETFGDKKVVVPF